MGKTDKTANIKGRFGFLLLMQCLEIYGFIVLSGIWALSYQMARYLFMENEIINIPMSIPRKSWSVPCFCLLKKILFYLEKINKTVPGLSYMERWCDWFLRFEVTHLYKEKWRISLLFTKAFVLVFKSLQNYNRK